MGWKDWSNWSKVWSTLALVLFLISIFSLVSYNVFLYFNPGCQGGFITGYNDNNVPGCDFITVLGYMGTFIGIALMIVSLITWGVGSTIISIFRTYNNRNK